MDNIFERVNHASRMARMHGDTDVFVDDPIRDWNERGVTYIAFDMSARVLKNSNGLSSRTISGSSGPIPLCTILLQMMQKWFRYFVPCAVSQMGS